jgi:hypothetical protein
MHAVKIGSNCRLKKIVVLANPLLNFAPCKKFYGTDSDYNLFRAMFGNNESLWKLIE